MRQLLRDGRTRLLHLERRRLGAELVSERVYLERDRLPADHAVGDVLHYTDGALVASPETVHDVARRKLERAIGQRQLQLHVERSWRVGGAL